MPTARRRKLAAEAALAEATPPVVTEGQRRSTRTVVKFAYDAKDDVFTSETAEAVKNKAKALVRTAKEDVRAAGETIEDLAEEAVGLGRRQWRVADLPAQAQFPVVVAASLAVASVGYAVLDAVTGRELARVSRQADTWSDAGVLMSWSVLELALGWFGNYDSFDVAALSVLTHAPSLYLISAFYNISPVTALAALAIHVLAAVAPFQLLRPLSGAHAGASSVPNKEIVTDVPIQVYTTLLSAAVYLVTVVTALRTVLPKFLVLYFEGIPSVQPAYEASYLPLIPVALLFGLATRSFVFTPFAAAADRVPEDAKLDNFHPASASLEETLVHNVWGYTAKTKVLILRTAALVALTGVGTYLQCAMTVSGVASSGAVAYASVWAVAGLLAGTALGLVGA